MRRPILLLELCLATLLVGMIVAILFSSYWELSIARSRVKSYGEQISNWRRSQLRLEQIFSTTIDFNKENADLYSLTYDNGVDLEPSFRGVVEAVLQVHKGGLYFVTWPHKQALSQEPRRELLLKTVTSCSIIFFDEEVGNWSELYPKLKPFMVKIILNSGQTTIPLFL